MIRRRDLLRALGDHDLADWTLVERAQDVVHVDPRLARTEHWLRWILTVHHDAPTGRGSAQVHIDAASGDADTVVHQAVTHARASISTAWNTRPTGAPARVTLAEPALEKLSPRELADAAATIVRSFARPGRAASVDGAVTILREQVAVVTRQGLRTDWPATSVTAALRATLGERVLEIRRDARRREDLALDAAIHAAADDLALLATASATPEPGACTLVLRTEALLHEGLGLWSTFISQADATVARQGLTRYREGAPVSPGADHVREPLSIVSDGALDFAVASAPIGDDGDAIRRFALVDGGMAAGLGLSPREASLRGREPNGGVRNLIVAPGTWDGRIPSSAPQRTLEIRRLQSLTFDPYTGDASLEILLGVSHAPDGGTQPFTGGSLRLDAVDALARARRSATTLRRGAYTGPDAVLIEGAELVT